MTERDLAGRLPEALPARTMHDPVSPDDDPALARRNLQLAAALWSVALLLFAGTFLIAGIYLLVD